MCGPQQDARAKPVGQHRPGERERGHQQADHRNSQRIGQRRGKRHLAKQQQQRRCKTHGHRPLHAAPLHQLHQPVRRPVAPDTAKADIKNHRHRAKRKPETRGEHRQGVEQQNRQQGKRQHPRTRLGSPQPKRQRDRANHVQRALCGHGKTGNKTIGKRRKEAS